MSTIELNIEGMHCGACVRRVKEALEGVSGVSVREVELGRAEVVLAHGSSEKAVIAEAEKAVVDAGFTIPRR